MSDRYRGRISFDDIAAGDGAVSPTSAPLQTSIEEVVHGLKESHNSTRMFDDLSKAQNESYMSRRPESDSLINQCRLQSGCNPRIDAWNEFVDTLRSSRLTPMSKVEAVNTWGNETIRYDDDKKATPDWRDWHQTPFTTLSSGTGQCTDIARLKYETLNASGAIADTDMRLVDGLLDDENGKLLSEHEVLVVNVDGKNLVLNDNFTGTHWPSNRPLLHGGVEQADVFVSGNHGGSAVNTYGRFVPQTADHENDTTYYPKENAADVNASGIIQNRSIGTDRSEAACTTDGNFCMDGTKQGDTKGELQGVLEQIEHAHGLKAREILRQPASVNPRVF
jgi:predicted transglutaminase-like cysteine proteinase